MAFIVSKRVDLVGVVGVCFVFCVWIGGVGETNRSTCDVDVGCDVDLRVVVWILILFVTVGAKGGADMCGCSCGGNWSGCLF